MKRAISLGLGIATGGILFASAAWASTGVHKLDVSFANIGITVGHKTVPTTAEPFIYNKNVYVPISTVAHALGAKVQWVNHPATVKVTGKPATTAVKVIYNGQTLPSGITDGTSYLAVPANDASYETASTLVPVVSATGDVNFQNQTAPAFPKGATPLVTLTPAAVYGDFADTTLYPGKQLSNFWPASVLGNLYPGEFTVEWGVAPGQAVKVPGVDYALGGKYTQFVGNVALDDFAKNFTGAVQLVFLGDGAQIGSTGWVQTGAQPVPITENVTGLQTLEIQVQLKSPSGTVYTMGQTYTPPAVNPDGSKTDPIVGLDLMGAYLQ